MPSDAMPPAHGWDSSPTPRRRHAFASLSKPGHDQCPELGVLPRRPGPPREISRLPLVAPLAARADCCAPCSL